MGKFDNRARLNNFLEEVTQRYLAGEKEYGDRSFDLSPPELLQEIQEEVLDICTWSFFLYDRLERADKALKELEDHIDQVTARADGESPDFPEHGNFDVALKNALEESDNPTANKLGREIFVAPGVGNRVGGGEAQKAIQHDYYGFDELKVVAVCDHCTKDLKQHESRVLDDQHIFCSLDCLYEYHCYEPEEPPGQ